jgi:hypothetical protein
MILVCIALYFTVRDKEKEKEKEKEKREKREEKREEKETGEGKETEQNE